MTRKIILPNLDNIIARYQGGEPEQKLARECGVSRGVIRRYLIERGIAPRNISQSMFIRMANATPEYRSAITKASHDAIRGTKRTIKDRTQRAKTRELKGLGISSLEIEFADMLKSRGITDIVHQKAIGIYNVDIALKSARIAIEINGGGWHNSEHHRRLHQKRIPFILNEGWHVVIIWVDNTGNSLTMGACDYIISLMQKFSLNKPAWSEYHVIRGQGNIVPPSSPDFQSITRIESPTTSF